MGKTKVRGMRNPSEEMTGSVRGSSATAGSIEIAVEDLLVLTEGAKLTMELEPATGSRLMGSYWVATLPALDVTASELGLEQTIERLAFQAVGAASEVVARGWDDREEKLPTALRILALESRGELVEELKQGEVVSERFLESVPPPDEAA